MRKLRFKKLGDPPPKVPSEEVVVSGFVPRRGRSQEKSSFSLSYSRLLRARIIFNFAMTMGNYFVDTVLTVLILRAPPSSVIRGQQEGAPRASARS